MLQRDEFLQRLHMALPKETESLVNRLKRSV